LILVHIVEMPYLYSGRDNQGRPWTALVLPAAFSRHLDGFPKERRAKVLKGLYEDFRRSTGEMI
jgi:hypothetical protein